MTLCTFVNRIARIY